MYNLLLQFLTNSFEILRWYTHSLQSPSRRTVSIQTQTFSLGQMKCKKVLAFELWVHRSPMAQNLIINAGIVRMHIQGTSQNISTYGEKEERGNYGIGQSGDRFTWKSLWVVGRG
ncbi:uncharacterized protein LOC131325405 [Rhododendron vialii]|uniref:uncharacterized protein LOC131325405 n=1 Tax=Rhododendron vialii TaxID=182163 RepID=UPI00265F63E5|nr:uncharacterized protein LOC131325405 [Rhododendron vialii]